MSVETRNGKREVVMRKKQRIITYPVTNYLLYLAQTNEFFKRSTKGFPRRKHLVDKINPFDFRFVKPIGMGTFAMIYLTELKRTGDYFAVKVLRKKTLIEKHVEGFVNRSRKCLEGFRFPFVQSILCSFQDTGFLFVCQHLMTGGDLFWHLRKEERFDEQLVVFYAAQIVLAIEYLHYLGIVHRNIKPENILVDHKGHLRLSGFTFVKRIHRSVTWTTCGTPEYMSPEMILNKGHTLASDWWSLGVLIYELVTGLSPFKADDIMGVFKKVLEGRYIICSYFSVNLEEILSQLLKRNPMERIGMRLPGVQDIKDVLWFQNIDWLRLVNQQLFSPYVPSGKKMDSNFPVLEPVEIIPPIEEFYSGRFRGF